MKKKRRYNDDTSNLWSHTITKIDFVWWLSWHPCLKSLTFKPMCAISQNTKINLEKALRIYLSFFPPIEWASLFPCRFSFLRSDSDKKCHLCQCVSAIDYRLWKGGLLSTSEGVRSLPASSPQTQYQKKTTLCINHVSCWCGWAHGDLSMWIYFLPHFKTVFLEAEMEREGKRMSEWEGERKTTRRQIIAVRY